MYTLVGLGNPGEEYAKTRHNAGRIILLKTLESFDFSELEKNKSAKALYAWGNMGKTDVEALFPETYMNKSGLSVKYAVTKHDVKPENVVVIYDDIDLPLGVVRAAFGRNSGGHNGIKSIERSLKTKDFIRIRVGVSKTIRGKAKKPIGEKAVLDFLMGNFTKKELELINGPIRERVEEALKVVFKTKDPEAGMNAINGLEQIK